MFKVLYQTGNDIYVDMRLGTANGNGSKIITSLGDPAATMADETTTQNTVKNTDCFKKIPVWYRPKTAGRQIGYLKTAFILKKPV